MNVVDLLIAWEWEYDYEYIQLLNDKCIAQNISTYLIHPHNVQETFDKFNNGQLGFKVLYDRASDADDRFIPLLEIARKQKATLINEVANALRATNKAAMHLEFTKKGIHVPYTVILSPYEKEPILKITELEGLGSPFIIKPSRGGGGTGVVMGAETLHDVIEARKQYGNDKYLLQEQVHPTYFNNRRAWFRVYYCCGKTILCWWDDRIHMYEYLSPEEESKYKLGKMHDIVKDIEQVCKLDFFSTEICKTVKDDLVCVDYVNDPCDMRLKSVCANGVPDIIANSLIDAIINHLKKLINK